MNQLISDASYEGIINDMEWPIYTIIKKCFFEFMSTGVEIGNITEVFNINNKLTYSLTTQDKFPTIIKTSKGIINGKETTLKTNEAYIKRNKERITYEKQKDDGMKIVNYIATRQREKHD